MKVTVLSHDLSSNAALRAHRLARAASQFADVELIGPVANDGMWPALPVEDWIRTVPKRRFPKAYGSLAGLVAAADGDVLIAVKPQLASFGVALVAGERLDVPVVVDLDDLDVALAPRARWPEEPSMKDLSRPGSAVYVTLLTRAIPAAATVTVASTALQRRFGGTLIPHGADTAVLDPARTDRRAVRRELGIESPLVLFPGVPRRHKGIRELAEAVARVEGVRLAVPCRESDLVGAEWDGFECLRLPVAPYERMAEYLAAADVVAVPQLDDEQARHQMPMKVYDAMSMGRPIVASAVSDIPDALDGCGRLVPPGDVGALAQAIEDLVADTAEAERLGAAARRRCVERFSLEFVAARLEAVVTRSGR